MKLVALLWFSLPLSTLEDISRSSDASSKPLHPNFFIFVGRLLDWGGITGDVVERQYHMHQHKAYGRHHSQHESEAEPEEFQDLIASGDRWLASLVDQVSSNYAVRARHVA